MSVKVSVNWGGHSVVHEHDVGAGWATLEESLDIMDSTGVVLASYNNKFWVRVFLDEDIPELDDSSDPR